MKWWVKLLITIGFIAGFSIATYFGTRAVMPEVSEVVLKDSYAFIRLSKKNEHMAREYWNKVKEVYTSKGETGKLAEFEKRIEDGAPLAVNNIRLLNSAEKRDTSYIQVSLDIEKDLNLWNDIKQSNPGLADMFYEKVTEEYIKQGKTTEVEEFKKRTVEIINGKQDADANIEKITEQNGITGNPSVDIETYKNFAAEDPAKAESFYYEVLDFYFMNGLEEEIAVFEGYYWELLAENNN